MLIPQSKVYIERVYKTTNEEHFSYIDCPLRTGHLATLKLSNDCFISINKLSLFKSEYSYVQGIRIVKDKIVSEGVEISYKINNNNFKFEYAGKKLEDFNKELLVKIGYALELQSNKAKFAFTKSKKSEISETTKKIFAILKNGTNNPFVLETILSDKEIVSVKSKTNEFMKKNVKNKAREGSM